MARTILLADDSPTIRKIVELTFSDTDLRVETAETGQEALEKIDVLRPDLVLADVVMPEPDGYEVCRAVKASARPVPVLLLAGTFEPFNAEEARACGADAHLVKPFESRVLRERVEALLARPEAAPSEAEGSGPGAVELESVMEELSDGPARPAARGEASGKTPAPPAAAGRESAAAPEIDPALVEAVAREAVKRLSEIVIREIAWEVVPELASRIVRERIRELEREEPGEE